MMKKVFALGLLLAVILAACSTATTTQEPEPFVIGAIPDQDPELLQRRFGMLADYLEGELGITVEYKPVTDYTASVTAFRVGDLDMVWFGGLTGVQARLQVEGAEAILQRDIDEQFHSVFIINTESGIEATDDIAGLSQLRGHTFTFGSESSTSGRLMPQSFLSEAGVNLEDFKGEPGFSGSHDATIDLVETGTYDAGAVNEQVWLKRVENGEVDLNKVMVLWRTPSYFDYHWVIRPDVTSRYGENFIDNVSQAFLNLEAENPEHAEILNLFSAEKFILTENDNYLQIETVGRDIGKIN
ncbi:MAG: putative selenate ABC transporter substrate-binding protein [Anaerolineales bacterium]|jgi:phosphonate transport system substrate-binding protein